MRSNYSHTFCEHRSVAALREIKSAFIPLPSPSFHVAQRKSGRRMLTLAYVVAKLASRCNFESAHCGDGAISMTMHFIDGFLAAMLPSILTVAWLAWRADPH